MPSPPSHLVPAPEPSYLSPLDTSSRPERPSSPPTVQTLNPEAAGGQGRRAGSSRAKKEGGRPTHKSADDGCRERAKMSKTNRGRSKERGVKDKKESTQCSSGTKLPHANGNSNMEHYTDLEHTRGLGERRPALPTKSSASGRKTAVSPGPWKIPGSDKLPSTLRSGTSTLSR